MTSGSLGVPLAHQNITPPQPNPTSAQPVAPDADTYRAVLYDCRRELMRARAAALPFNFILGGFAATLTSDGTVIFSPGVAHVRIPIGDWSGTFPPSSGALYGPTESPTNTLAGATYDGAYRAERRVTSVIIAGNGTTGPATGDSIVYLTYDPATADRLSVKWHLVSGFALDAFSVPIAWVRVAGGVITMVRDLRPMPPWRPRFAQRIYGNPPDPTVARWIFPLASGVDANAHPTGASTLIPVDVGSFWLDAGQAVLFTAAVMVESDAIQQAREGVQIEFDLSRGDPADAFVGRHYWYGDVNGTIAPQWKTSFMNVGRNWFNATCLFLPRTYTDNTDNGAVTVPGVFHFNGIFVIKIEPANFNDTVIGSASAFMGCRFAYLKAELAQVRMADLDATIHTPLPTGSEVSVLDMHWENESYPPVQPPKTG